MRDFRLRGKDWLIIAALVAVVAALYTRTATFGFVNYDDDQYVFENPHIKSGLTSGGIAWAFSEAYACNWHPLTWMSHMLDVELFGVTAGGPHIVNALLHAANGVLLFIALFRLTGDRWPAAFCAALFAIHPLRVESVAWISERKDVLSGLFWMLALISYERYARRPAAGRYLLVLILFLLGLLSKPMVITLPCVLLLLDFWPLGRFTGWAACKRLILEKLPMFALAAGASVVTYLAQQSGEAVSSMQFLPPKIRAFNSIVSYCVYLQQTIWPTNLAVFYPHPGTFTGREIPISIVMLCSVFLLGVSIAAILLIRRAPWFGVGWAWYLGTLVPVIGIVQVGLQSHADRYTYLTVIGISIAVVWSLHALIESRRNLAAAFTACGVAALALLFFISWRQVGYWRNSETLMRHAIAVVPDNYLAYNNLGHELITQEDKAGAESVFREMVRINPQDATALNNLAVSLADRGEEVQAEKLYREAIQNNPRYVLSYVHLANLHARQGRRDAAAMLYDQAISRGKNAPEPYHNKAILLAEMNQYDEALKNWEIALRLKPEYADAHHGYGVALLVTGNSRGGIDHLRRALELEPGRVDSLMRLAWVLATHPQADFRDPAALTYAQRAAQLSKKPDPVILDTLAAAFAQNADFRNAVMVAEEAMKLADAQPQLAEEIRRRLELYRAGRPFVQGMR